jgi:hypothetical protein
MAADLLNLCAFLAPEAIALGDLAEACRRTPREGETWPPLSDPLFSTMCDDLALDDARALLLRYSLAGADGGAVKVHRLVQKVTRERLDAESRKTWLRAALCAA